MNEREFIKKLIEILWYELEFDKDYDIRQLLKKYMELNK